MDGKRTRLVRGNRKRMHLVRGNGKRTLENRNRYRKRSIMLPVANRKRCPRSFEICWCFCPNVDYSLQRCSVFVAKLILYKYEEDDRLFLKIWKSLLCKLLSMVFLNNVEFQ